MQATAPIANIYLGSPFYSKDEIARSKEAKKLLQQNPTVAHIFFPFDKGFHDPEEKNPQPGGVRSMTWRVATYNNDIVNLVDATCGVFLYDMDQIDDGSAFEIGFMRALHKPVVLVPFTKEKKAKPQMNLMLAQGVTTLIDGNSDFDKLKSYDFSECPAQPVKGYGML